MPGAIDPYKMGGNWETGHVFRYRLASGFVDSDCNVVDFGCGKGYGSQLLSGYYSYIGIDIDEQDIKEAEDNYGDGLITRYIVGDLNTHVHNSGYEMAVCFECIEHVENTDHLIKLLKQAERYIICSVPIIPTVGINPHHRHDYDYDTLPKMIVDENWRLYQRVKQQGSDGNDVYGIYVFERTK